MVSFQEYADSHHISYEAVRQSIKRHKEELKGHISKQGRKQYLDDIAVSILDKYRNKGNVSVFDPEEQKNSNETIDALKNQIIYLQHQIIELQSEAKLGIEAKTKLQMIEGDLESLKAENSHLKTENQSYQKTIFGLYRKVSK